MSTCVPGFPSFFLHFQILMFCVNCPPPAKVAYIWMNSKAIIGLGLK